jgi:acetylornithine deacetylase/succinyl-diaminopimelate desuccinylase-like protein
MSREHAIAKAAEYFDSGAFLADLARRVAMPTESQVPGRLGVLRSYLADEMAPCLQRLGFTARIIENPVDGFGPFFVGERHEADELPTVLSYGHGDVVCGYDALWRDGLDPWRIVVDGERWYGRGTADNKGQHTINLAALAQVIAARGGKLGFNTKIIIEMGEETGSPGLRAMCEKHREILSADLLIASDGPRLSADRPAVFLGTRGAFNFELFIELRKGAHHSGNWGGALRNPGTVLANAIASLVDQDGCILLDALSPPPIPDSVRRVLAGISVGGEPGDPEIDRTWGEPDLTPAERVFAWNTVELLAFTTGNPEAPLNAIPPNAKAVLQLRFVVGTDWRNLIPIIRAHLDRNGFGLVEVRATRMEAMAATRLDPDNPWVHWAIASIERTTGKKADVLPNAGGSLPNDVFADLLGLPTIWVPHSYRACSQHAPNEHLLASTSREALAIMAGLFWDLGENGPEIAARQAAAAASS